MRHGAELVDLDNPPVEPVTLLLEEHRPRAVHLDQKRDESHRQEQTHEEQRTENSVLDQLDQIKPSGYWLVGHIEHRNTGNLTLTEAGITVADEVRGKTDMDRQLPEPLHQLADPLIGIPRQGDDDVINSMSSGEGKQMVHRTENWYVNRLVADPFSAVLEHADNSKPGLMNHIESIQELLGLLPGADQNNVAANFAHTRPGP